MATKKLSAAQQKVLDEARAQIDYARTHTKREWLLKHEGFKDEQAMEATIEYLRKYGHDPEKTRQRFEERLAQYDTLIGHWYEDNLNGIVLVHCKGQMLHKLAELGYFEIIEDTTGSESWSSDVVKVLNY